MRLSLVQKTLDSAPIGEAALSLTPVPNQPSTLISNLHGFKKFLASVDNIPALASQVSFLKNSWAYATQQNQLQFPNTDASYHTIVHAASDLIRSARVLKETLHHVGLSETEECISVKLSNDSGLRNVSDTLTSLNKAIAQVIAESPISGEVVVRGWEIGSLWIVLYLGTIAAVKLVADLVRAALIVRQEKLKGDWIEQQISGYQIKNDLVDNLASAVNAHLKHLVESESRAIEDKTFDTHDNERQERLKESIRILADLTYKGIQIYPSLDAPPEIREIFPDPNAFGTVLSTIQQLENSNPQSASQLPQSPPAST
jgi:hypothetical protein